MSTQELLQDGETRMRGAQTALQRSVCWQDVHQLLPSLPMLEE